MEELVESYLADLPTKAENLEQTVEQAIHDLSQHGQTSLKNLEHLVHTIAGSAGTYGFYSLSAACAFLENHISQGTFDSLESDQSIKFLRLWTSIFLKHHQSILRTRKPEQKGIAKTVEKELEAITSYLGSSRQKSKKSA